MSSIETIYGQSIPQQIFGWGFSKTMKARLSLWLENYRSRQRLQDLSNESLDDLGLSREEAREEARRPFWDTARIGN